MISIYLSSTQGYTYCSYICMMCADRSIELASCRLQQHVGHWDVVAIDRDKRDHHRSASIGIRQARPAWDAIDRAVTWQLAANACHPFYSGEKNACHPVSVSYVHRQRYSRTTGRGLSCARGSSCSGSRHSKLVVRLTSALPKGFFFPHYEWFVFFFYFLPCSTIIASSGRPFKVP